MKKAVIFDMDGVLIDSEPLYYRGDVKMFEKLGLEMTQEDSQLLLGTTPRKGATNILNRHPEISCTLEELVEMYEWSLLNALKTSEELCLIDGVYDWILRLDKMGVPMAIASSSTKDMVDYIADRFGLSKIMKEIVNGQMITKSKPDPEIFLLAADKLGMSPENCTVIEDSSFGVSAAKAAGMRCLAYTANNIHGVDLSAADARFDVYNNENFEKFFDWVGK